MATFGQWNRKRVLKRMAWVCGPEPLLVDEVLQAYRGGAAPDQGVYLFAGEDPEHKVWDEVLTAPPGVARRVVVHAEKLRQTENFAILAGAEGMDTVFTVFVAGEDDFPRIVVDGKKKLAPHLAVLQASRHGQLIRCCAPGKQEDLIRLVASWWPGAGANLADELLERCGGSLTSARQACEKAVRAGFEPTLASVECVRLAVPGREFTDQLIAGDKRDALLAAQFLPRSEIGAALGLLASRLAMLAAIGDAKRRGWDHGDLAVRLKIHQKLLRQLAPHTGAYPPERVRRCQELLAIAETAWRAGAYEGVPEAVISLW